TATVPPGKTFVSATRSSPFPADDEGAAPAAPSLTPTCCSDIRSLGAEEVVESLHLVGAVAEVGIPGRVVARPVGEGAAVANLALLDVADVAGDARQVGGGGFAVVPEGVL